MYAIRALLDLAAQVATEKFDDEQLDSISARTRSMGQALKAGDFWR